MNGSQVAAIGIWHAACFRFSVYTVAFPHDLSRNILTIAVLNATGVRYRNHHSAARVAGRCESLPKIHQTAQESEQAG